MGSGMVRVSQGHRSAGRGRKSGRLSGQRLNIRITPILP
ncbi:hypothetical protein BV133_2756 [Blastochloris viridis]|uniref:Uncharacterized protein n=1 Tax=Blastochloris viridis TaxID=1079 RepID=A0A182D4H6_BLAVI|nr:hypothetical protein BV133_2756 [Blastochloris viridis]